MSKRRLVKVATEFNVGVSTISDFLSGKGFDVSRPNDSITEEMYDLVQREYGKSREIREQADQMNIGSVRQSAPPPAEPKKETPAAPKAAEKETAPSPKDENMASNRPVLNRPGALGKIDLKATLNTKRGKAEQDKGKPKEESPAQPTPEAPHDNKAQEKTAPEAPQDNKAPQVPQPQQTPAPSPKANEPAKQPEPQMPKADQDGLIRAEAPQLKGLKIMGKIDVSKFDSRGGRGKKKDEKPAKADDKTKPDAAKTGNSNSSSSSSSAESEEEKKKRRRKRRKVKKEDSPAATGQGAAATSTPANTTSGTATPPKDAAGARGPKKDDNKKRPGKKEEGSKDNNISQKEIDDHIKATMARISGGKSKRQKVRRENRDIRRERESNAQQGDEKLQITEYVSVAELASLLEVQPTEVITTCMSLGFMVSINQRLDADLIEMVALEFGVEVEFVSAESQLELESDDEQEDSPEDLSPRAPIVTVMGHVDHGKTSLLDYIRNANVVAGEAGGITQHIGAYEVRTKDGKKVTFLDTPGHEAFTAMRARGAKVTDVAVIIIAADDQVMPQTKEAISHAQAANVPMVFAINKVDKAGADPERIKKQLAEMNLLVEDWGGKYQSQEISAKKGLNIDELLEKITLEADLLELQANPKRSAVGVVLEASLEKGRGYVAKILVQNGTMRIGDPIVAGEHSGKIKAMLNERGSRLNEAGPSQPVMVLGLSGAPQAGEKVKVMTNEQEARQLASRRAQIAREQANRARGMLTLEEIGRRLKLGNFKELNLIIKGDMDGSVEALTDALLKLSIETVQVRPIHRAVGPITESDVMLATASDAIIIGFQVRPTGNARKIAEREGVQIKTYSIIYEAIEEIKLAIEGMLEPTQKEEITGEVEIREVFNITKVGTVAGCYVRDGKVTNRSYLRVIRDGIVVFPVKEGVRGEIASLKRFKDDQKEVKAGYECGLQIHNFNDYRPGDILEVYDVIEVKTTLASLR